MKKVLIIGLTERMGGVETFIYNTTIFSNKEHIQYDYLIHGADHAQFQKQLSTFYGNDEHFHFVSHFKSKPIKAVRELYSLYKTHHYDAIHLQTGATFEIVYCFPYNFIFGIDVITHSHNGNGFSKFQNAIFRPILNFCTKKKLACSKVAAEWLFGKHKGKDVEVIKNGIDVNRFAFSVDKRNEMRKQYGVTDKFVIGHIGRFSEQKNHKFILEVYKEILNRNDQCVLFLIGTGELLTEIKILASEKNLTNKIVFINTTSTPEDFYCMFDAFLMPSLYEGLPIVGVEAQCAGLNCYFSNNISPEIEISDCCHILPLEMPAYNWAEKIIEDSNEIHNRGLYPSVISRVGFNVHQVVARLEQIYNEL